MVLFCEIVAKRAGFILVWDKVEQKQWIEANIAGYYGNLQPLIKIFTEATTIIV